MAKQSDLSVREQFTEMLYPVTYGSGVHAVPFKLIFGDVDLVFVLDEVPSGIVEKLNINWIGLSDPTRRSIAGFFNRKEATRSIS
ncbi:MAG: hypothetical protein F4180_08900 [Chloroflexi bacterium]|nr:hypothetical protein [Chloroflexota bacterium]